MCVQTPSSGKPRGWQDLLNDANDCAYVARDFQLAVDREPHEYLSGRPQKIKKSPKLLSRLQTRSFWSDEKSLCRGEADAGSLQNVKHVVLMLVTSYGEEKNSAAKHAWEGEGRGQFYSSRPTIDHLMTLITPNVSCVAVFSATG